MEISFGRIGTCIKDIQIKATELQGTYDVKNRAITTSAWLRAVNEQIVIKR